MINYLRPFQFQVTASAKQMKTLNTSEIDNKANGKENSLQHDLRKAYCDSHLSDFNVKVRGKSFPVHTFILAVRSPVLNRMLETNMKESSDKTLELDDLDESTVAQMLEYMYTDDPGELCLESALKLYYAGDKYDISGLKELSSKFLESSLSCSIVCDVLEMADRHQDEHLKSTAVQYILKHVKEMMKQGELRKFSQRNPELYIETSLQLTDLKF